MQIALAKFQGVRGTSLQLIPMRGCLTIGHMCWPCLPNFTVDEFST